MGGPNRLSRRRGGSTGRWARRTDSSDMLFGRQGSYADMLSSMNRVAIGESDLSCREDGESIAGGAGGTASAPRLAERSGVGGARVI